ncbi:hypothetical protein ABZW18_24600 [Streptomyces sp. NPDC004647]|uniref:hypothetical protein n=1 Tax=Streptomyces sp. NPDC004647 TaxID=3154671 RepID=UPI0033B6DE18
MRTGVAAALLALAALSAAGCGEEETTVSTRPDRDRFEERSTEVVRDWPKIRPVSGHHDDMLPLEGVEHPRDAAAGKVKVLTLRVGHGACDADYGALVHETDKLVVVAGWAVEKDVDVCTDQLLVDRVKVRLKQDLGERGVVDAATGKQLLDH